MAPGSNCFAALDFLATTLECLDNSTLTTSQVKLLVNYFGALFDADHKAGVLPSLKALRRLSTMATFAPQQGDDILRQLCKLGEDFRKQIPETRLAAFQLIQDLSSNPDVASALQHQYGASCGFVIDLLALCRNERNPACLIPWFAVLRDFLTQYSPSPEVTEEIFNVFSAYFPISLNRDAQKASGISADELKLALRRCFASHHRVAKLAIPFLLKKLDQGDGVTVNVKVCGPERGPRAKMVFGFRG